MTLQALEARIADACCKAVELSERCEQLIDRGDFAAALSVCEQLSIEAPQCSLTASSEDANRLRDSAGRKLSDAKWWKKALEARAIRSYEAEQSAAGKVTNFVSDGLFAYYEKHRRKR